MQKVISYIDIFWCEWGKIHLYLDKSSLVTEWMNQSINQLIYQCLNESINQWLNQGMNEMDMYTA